MTLQEIQDLAGHRDVPPWVVKLVGDAVAKEREACAKLIAKLTEMLEIQQKLHETAIDMLKPAIEAEREACAKRLDAVGGGHCADNIRLRGQE